MNYWPRNITTDINCQSFKLDTLIRFSLYCSYVLSVLVCFYTDTVSAQSAPAHIRINQVGYLPEDNKIGIAFSNNPLKGKFDLIDAQGKVAWSGTIRASLTPGYDSHQYYYLLDFSVWKQPGQYRLQLEKSKAVSSSFRIDESAYDSYHEDLLLFMRQQRCGYNPWFDETCHEKDGRAMDGPMPDSTYIDVRGGWHDAGDQLKYLITGSNATARMLMAYQLFPDKFADQVNALGQPGANGIPDVLDEAKWGLDWIHQLHPQPGQLFHQVADDRDHIGFKLPAYDQSDYGWGKNSYRVAYFATGEPQGLGRFKSQATGIANLAGRSAAAMALAYQVWEGNHYDEGFAIKCLIAAEDLYRMAKQQEGYQQGNSFGAPYRYNEDTWTDDMEWAAAELYKATGNKHYLEDAKHYAELTGTLSWIERDTTAHYQHYPFLNIAHYNLYSLVDDDFKKKLAGYYRAGIEQTLKRANSNAFQYGVPFIWCSNNLAVDLSLQILLYEKMTGDQQYHRYALAIRDWLLGRNPWGTSMFTNIPKDGVYPVDVHTSTWALTKREVPGGLVDGPIYRAIYDKLLGLTLTKPDALAEFQNSYVVYHNDIGDYSTNEPTMDGTACAIMLMAWFASGQ
jgi:endoglucanase